MLLASGERMTGTLRDRKHCDGAWNSGDGKKSRQEAGDGKLRGVTAVGRNGLSSRLQGTSAYPVIAAMMAGSFFRFAIIAGVIPLADFALTSAPADTSSLITAK
jgi:hypothetical protein